MTRGYLLLPIVVLIVTMSVGYTPSRAACLAILAAIVVSMFHRDTRLTPKAFVEALENGARNTIGVAAACSIAGIIVGVVTLTGIGLKLAEGLLFLSGGIDLIALFLTMIACLIFGDGRADNGKLCNHGDDHGADHFEANPGNPAACRPLLCVLLRGGGGYYPAGGAGGLRRVGHLRRGTRCARG